MAILNEDGNELASANAFGLGGTESREDTKLDAGTYFLRITGENNADANLVDTQFYGLTASFNATAIPEPSAAGLIVRSRASTKTFGLVLDKRSGASISAVLSPQTKRSSSGQTIPRSAISTRNHQIAVNFMFA